MRMIKIGRVMFCFLTSIAVALILTSSPTCLAQAPDFSNPPSVKRPRGNQPRETTPARPKPSTPARPSNAKKSKFPAPEIVDLETKDGVKLVCTWFPPEGAGKPAEPAKNGATQTAQPNPAGKTTSPFILLHDWDGSRTDLLYLSLIHI